MAKRKPWTLHVGINPKFKDSTKDLQARLGFRRQEDFFSFLCQFAVAKPDQLKRFKAQLENA